MWLDRVSNLGPLAHESDTLPTALQGPADTINGNSQDVLVLITRY